MHLEDLLLSERSQSQEDRYCRSPLIRGNKSSHVHRDRKYTGGGRVGRHGLNGEEFQIGKMDGGLSSQH